MGPGGSISHDGAELGSFGEGENLYAGWAGSAQGPGTRFSNGNSNGLSNRFTFALLSY